MWETTVDGRPLKFRLAGINNQNFIMQDEETGSWWQQVTGEAVLGPLKGKRLKLVSHDELSFAIWRGEHPDGRVLRPDDSKPWREFSENWEEETARMPVVTKSEPGDALPPREVIIGVKVGERAVAYPLAALREQSPIVDNVAGRPIILVLAEDGQSVRVFESAVEGKRLELFKKEGVEPWRLTDTETGSEWDFSGRAVAGPLTGSRLPKIDALKDYWFDWKTYNPATTIYKR